MKIFRLALHGVLALSLLPALAQQPAAQMGKIHGHVINYTGQPQPAGLICLSSDNGVTIAYTFPVDSHGNYAGEAPAGTYFLVYRMPDTPPSLWIDAFNNITITVGKDLEQNDDMSRPAVHRRAARRTEEGTGGVKETERCGPGPRADRKDRQH